MLRADLLRKALFFLATILLIGKIGPIFSAEPTSVWKEPKKIVQGLLPQRDGDPEQRRSLSFPTPLQSVWSGRSMEKAGEEDDATNNALPGLGTLKAPVAASPSLGREFLGGSLELTTPFQRLVPAIYVEGEGYLPITHPAIEPYLSPEVRANPEADPSVVMIPEGYLTGQVLPVPTTVADTSRTVNVSGNTILSLPQQDHFEPIVLSADSGWMKQNETHEIYYLSGDCSVRQGDSLAQGPRAVVWVDRHKNKDTQTREATIYLESGASQSPIYIESAPGLPEAVGTRIFDQKWLGRFTTRSSIEIAIMKPEVAHEQEPAIHQRALAALAPEQTVIQREQYVRTSSTTIATGSASPRYRRITLNPRRDNEYDIANDPYPNDPSRGIIVITKGINIIIEGVQDDHLLGNTVDISADNAVVWMSNPSRLSNNKEHVEESNKDFELYLEGNIIFRDGPRIIEAHRMYYDAKNNLAYILEGRMDTPIIGIKGIDGSLRVKAEILQQLGEGVFTAKNSLVTTSRLGQPTYSLRSRTMTMTEKMSMPMLGSTEPVKRQILVSENNYLAAQNVPVFYWPWMAADLKDPTFYLKNISYGNSDTYGNRIRTEWNPFQLLNIRNRPAWLDGDVSVSWMEKRGIGYGGDISYTPPNFCCIPGQTNGYLRYWGINDKGADRLGGARNNVEFPHKYRYQFLWKHRQHLDSLWRFNGPWTFDAQVGKVSDRNFLNNYYATLWNAADNYTTAVDLKKNCGDSTFSVFAEYALDDFYTNANWLPRLDHYLLGRSLWSDRLTWYGHTRVGYMDYSTATAPYDWNRDGRYFHYLPWELTTNSLTNAVPNPANPTALNPETIDMSCEVFSTRHELDLPFNIGPVRCVPYVLGDFSHWGKDRSGKDVQRLYGQGGIRLNLPFWKVLSNCSSRSWYVNGLAHKVDFDAELSYARADKSMDDLLMTDALDNWSVEDFRRRYSVTTFGANGGTIPMMFDPRYYALRTGMAGNVTAKNMEIADDLTLCRFGMTHRWQTKRGPVGNRHIIDWITLSTHLNFYPETEQNYGKSLGLIDYDFLWHVGDRFSLFSSGLYDVFEDGQRITRVGGVWNRPDRGSFSLMYDQLEGIIQRNYLTLSIGYNMNEKYSVMYSSTFEVKTDRWENNDHNFMFTRTGESFRLMIGAHYNHARDDWGFSFGIEPVFMRGIASRMNSMSKTVQQNQR